MRRLHYFMCAILALTSTAPLNAQQPTSTVRGRITDNSTQQPIAGATVAIAGKSVLTQQDGRFAINGVPVGPASVTVRMVGYAQATQPVIVNEGEVAVVDLTLAPQAIDLSEIVVTGYGEQRAGNITGAVTKLSSEEFNPGRVVSPEQLVQNKIPGVLVVDNNEPGGGLSLRVRGPTSVDASSEPLYVIDGVPVAIANGAGGGLSAGRNPMNFVNPNDIESITVLRDASSAAIYGANAANGVIIITTKRGGGTPQVDYQGTTSASEITKLPSMLNADQFRTAVQTYATPSQISQLGTANTDWLNQIGQTAFGQEHNVSIMGRGENTDWRLSGGYLNQDGVISGTTLNRITLGLNMNQRLFDDALDVRASVRGSREDDEFTPGGVLSNAAQMGPTQPIYDSTAPTGYYDWPGNTLQSPDNPLAILGLAHDKGRTYRAIGNVQAAYALPWVQGLKANVNVGFDLAEASRQTFFPSTLHGQSKTGQDGSDYRNDFSESNATFEMFGSYLAPVRAIPGTIDLTAGYSYSQRHAEYPEYLATRLDTDILDGNGISGGQVQNFHDIQENRLISFFGRLNYNLNDRYLLSASLRRDGSSRFGSEAQWGTFPAISAGWRISQESFMQNMGSISDLKLRASYGKTGNQSFRNYVQYGIYQLSDAQTQMQFGTSFVTTIRPGAYNPFIQWEETKSYNLGLDYGFSDQRFTGAIDWYVKNTDKLIFTVPVCAGCGLSNFNTINVGTMKNNGLEMTLSAKVLRSPGGLNWTADFQGSHNTNELTKIYASTGTTRILRNTVAGGVGTFIQVLQPGEPVNSFFVYQHRRDAAGAPIYADNNGLSGGKFTGAPDGTINEQDLYVDLNGDSVINQSDRRPFHDPAPKWILGHSSYLTYGKFDMSFSLRAYLGNWVYNNVASNLGTYSEVTRASPYNLHSSVLETNFTTPQYLSDYYVEDASFLRMDNISAGYTFNYQSKPIRLFATVQNVFTITGYNGIDPTAGLFGIDNNIYPRSRTFTGGLSVRF